MSNKNNRKIVLAISFIIPFLITVICLITGGFAPFGTKNIISAGNHNEFLPYFYEYYDHFHNGGLFFFDKTYGLGDDFLSFATYYFSDPTNLLLLIFPRTMLIGVLDILFAFKIGAASVCCSIYLLYKKEQNETLLSSTISEINEEAANETAEDLDNSEKTSDDSDEEASNKDKKKKKNSSDFVIGFKNPPVSPVRKFIEELDWTIIAFSIAFATATTMITIGSNITYLSSMAILPLIIMGLDKLINENKKLQFIITLALSIIFNIHISIISLIFILIYFFTRDFKDFRNMVNRTGAFIGASIISILLSGFVWINAFQGNFINKEICLEFPASSLTNPYNCLAQFATRTPVSFYSLYGNHIDIAMGAGFIFLVVMYLFSKDIPIVARLKNVFIFVLLFSGTFSSTTRYLFNGFSLTAENYIHFGYVLTFMAIILGYDYITRNRSFSSKRVLLSGLIVTLLFVSGMLLSEMYENTHIFIVTFEFIFGYFMIYLTYSSKSLTKPLLIILTAILVLGECIPSYYTNLKSIGTNYLSQSLIKTNTYQIYEIARQIKSKDPKATIMYYQSETDDMVPTSYIFSGYDYIITQSFVNEENGLVEDVTSDYINNSIFTIQVFKTTYKTTGTVFDSSINAFKYNERYPFITSNIFTEDYLKDNPIFYDVEMNVNVMESSDNEYVNFIINPYSSGDLYVTMFSTRNFGTIVEGDELQAIQKTPAFRYLTKGYNYKAAIFDKDTFINILNTKTAPIPSISDALYSRNGVNISSDKNGYISTGIPVLKTLNYYVNGNKVTPVKFFDNNALLPVNEGDNTINVKYNPTYLIIGLLATLIGIILVILTAKAAKSQEKEMKTKINGIINKLEDHIAENKVYYITVALMSLVFLISLLISSCKPFGDSYPIFGDGLLQTYSINAAHFRSIKNGELFSFYNFNIAGFIDAYRYQFIIFLFHPWLVIRDYVFPNSSAIFFTVIDAFTNYIFTGLSIIFYLTHKFRNRFDKKDTRLVAIAMIYGLSNFALAFYEYKTFMFMQLVPLIILGFEQLIYRKKSALYICILVLFMTDDAYHAFILCEFLALYFFTMEFESVKDFIAKGIRFAISSIVGAALSAIALLPYYLLFIGGSAYQEQDAKAPSLFKFFSSYIDLFSYYRIGNEYNSVSNDEFRAGIYCGFIVLITIPLYILCKEVKVKYKIKNLIIVLLLFLSFNNELLNYVFHGFHYQSMVPNRNAAFFIFMVCILFAECLYYIDKISSRKLIYSILGLCSVMTLIYINTLDLNKGTSIMALVLVFIYAVVSTVYVFIKKCSTRTLTNILLYIVIIELIANSTINFARILAGNSSVVTISNSIDDLVDNREELSKFYNTTNLIGDHDLLFNMGYSSKINSLSFFASGLTDDTMKRINTYNVKTNLNNCNYNSGNPLADMMLHVKYQIKYVYDDTAYSIYDKVYQHNEFSLYENPYALGLGFSIPNVSATDERINPNKYNAFIYQNMLCEYLGGNDIYNTLDIEEYTPTEDGSYDENKNLFTFGESYEYENLNTTTDNYRQVYIHIDNNISGYVYADVGTFLYCLGKADENNHDFSIDYPVDSITSDFKPSIAILNEDNLKALHDSLKPGELQNLTNNGRKITGSFTASNDGALYISIPYYKGWTIYIDGQEIEKQRFLGGMGVNVTAGEHKLEMKYTPPGMYSGIIISVSTLLLLITNSIIKSKFKEKKKRKTNSL